MDAPASNPGSFSGFAGCVLRLVWAFGGVMALFFIGIFVAQGGPSPGALDLAYALVAVALVLVRLVDVRWLGGVTVDGDRATMATWRAWALRVLLGAGAGWAVARLVARSGLLHHG